MTTKSKSPKKTIATWKEEWNVPIGAWMRWPGQPLQSIYWYWLSRQVRKEEWERWGGFCITCDKRIDHWLQGVCGHIIAVTDCGEYLKLDRRNLTIQHKHCNDNKLTPMAAALNLRNYDKRYGPGAWDRLYNLRNEKVKKLSQSVLRQLIQNLPSYQESTAPPKNSFSKSLLG